MDRRLALALLLSGLAVVVSSMLFPPAPRRVPRPTAVADTAPPVTPELPAVRQDSLSLARIAENRPADTVGVRTARAVYRFSTLGAVPVAVTLPDYKALNRDSGSVELVRDSVPLLAFSLVSGRDTVRLSETVFAATGPNNTGVA